MSWRSGSYNQSYTNNIRTRNENSRNAQNDLDWRRQDPDNKESVNKNSRTEEEISARPEQKKSRRSKRFMIGLRNDDEVICAVSPQCGNLDPHYEIVSVPEAADLEKSFSNIDGLNEALRPKLRSLKQKGHPSFMTVHHGVMHYFELPEEGTYQVGSLLQNAGYERLFPNSVNFDFINKLPCVKEIIRFDFTINTPDGGCRLWYHVYVRDGSFVRDINEIDEYLSKLLVPVSLAPGFLVKRAKDKETAFDIINPKKNVSTRLKLGYVDPNERMTPLMIKHGNILKDVFQKIQIKSETTDLQLNVLDLVFPHRYKISYYRRSFRKDYIFHDNQLRISTEKVYHNTQEQAYSNSRVEKDIADVFIWNSSLSETFADPDWNEEDALAMIENVLKFQEDVMDLLE